jgi:ribonuclease BN (tRNA processing enzyme)
MRLTVLGCAGGIPTPSNPNTALLLRAADTAVLIDFGHGAMGALQRHLDPEDLDAVVVTHLHADHTADLPALLVQRRYNPVGREERRPLPLHAPDGAIERIGTAYAPTAEARASEDASDVFDHRPLRAGESFRIGPLTFHTHEVEHTVEAFGFRVEDGASTFAFSGDSGPCAGVDALAAGADLLMIEATWETRPGLPPHNHMTGTQAGEAAARAGAGRTLLTHNPTWRDADEVFAEAAAVYGGPLEWARAGETYEVGGGEGEG